MTSPADILRVLAISAAGSVELFGTEKADLVDVLQEFAGRADLVELLGQDLVQAIVAAPFVHLGESTDFPLVPDAEFPSDDYALRIIQRWEMADRRDRWRHTGELPPAPAEIFAPAPKYRTPQATVDAFFYVARNESAENIAAWLGQHSADVPFLRDIAEGLCTSR